MGGSIGQEDRAARDAEPGQEVGYDLRYGFEVEVGVDPAFFVEDYVAQQMGSLDGEGQAAVEGHEPGPAALEEGLGGGFVPEFVGPPLGD